MNRSMVTGLLGGVGLATAGGVAGFVLLGEPSSTDGIQGTLEPELAAVVEESPEMASAPAQASAPVMSQPRAEAVQVQAAVEPAPVEERCWDEEVTVQVDPKDENAIAGTATGAVLGGAIAKKVGDDNDLLTVAGAIGGAFAGRRVQQKIQENNTTTRIERRCEPAEAQ
jgi:uncharacterized protein YcfJ